MESMLLVNVMTFLEHITDNHRQALRTTGEKCLSLIASNNAGGTGPTARCVSAMRTTVSCSLPLQDCSWSGRSLGKVLGMPVEGLVFVAWRRLDEGWQPPSFVVWGVCFLGCPVLLMHRCRDQGEEEEAKERKKEKHMDERK